MVHLTHVCAGLLFFLAATWNVCVADESAAKILVSKTILNEHLVEDRDITIVYNIYNIGNSPALNVSLSDTNFDQGFKHVRGTTGVTWDKIAPGANMTHIVIVQALETGAHNFTAATISYLSTDDTSEPQVSLLYLMYSNPGRKYWYIGLKTHFPVFQLGYSTMPGDGFVMLSKDYLRKFSSHLMDWLTFGLMTLPSLGIPFILWYRSKSKYETILAKSKKAN